MENETEQKGENTTWEMVYMVFSGSGLSEGNPKPQTLNPKLAARVPSSALFLKAHMQGCVYLDPQSM